MKMTKSISGWKKLSLAVATAVMSHSAIAATTATIDLNTQKFIGGVSDLDRSKYFNIHSQPLDNNTTQAEWSYLINDLNIGFGRSFWSPFSVYSGNAPYPDESFAQTNGPGVITSSKNHPNYNFFSNNYIVTEHTDKIFAPNENPVEVATWAANYFKHYFDNTTRPLYYEPMNEPFIKSDKFGLDQVTGRQQMTNIFAEIGKKFTQEGISTKVIGYASAWPSMEKWDFGHFNGRMKYFMDVAGPHIDAISFHPYDGVNVTGADNERSGSNLEALLDLVETYSHFKWDSIKPIAITEYGGIEEGYGDTYSDLRSAQSLRSQNKMLMQLLNRQDRLLTTIPFNTGKSTWHYNAANNWNPYGAAIMRPDPNSIVNGAPTNFFWTKRIDFYRLWSDVKGKRVKVESTNPDIQVNAFVSGNKAYVALNTLADYWETVNLDFVNSLGTVTNVRKKRLVAHQSNAPIYEDTNIAAPSSFVLQPSETIVLEYTFNSNVNFTDTYNTSHYYADEHTVSINAGVDNTFTFNGVSASAGNSVLRIAMGRAHGASLQPTISVNGTIVPINLNWGGGNQSTRDEFFGVVEAKLNNSLLQANNTVKVTFPDSGGRVASVVLQVNNDSNGAAVPDSIEFANNITILPSQTNYSFTTSYGAAANRDIYVELWKGSNYLTFGKTTVNAGPGVATVSLNVTPAPTVGANDYVLKAAIRPLGTGWQQNIDNASISNISISSVVVPSGYTRLKFSSSGKCADIKDGGLTDGVKIQQWGCYSSSNQNFQFTDIGDGYFTIKNQTSGKCIDKTNSTQAGAVVHQWTCDTTNDNQIWSFLDAGSGKFQLKNKNSSLCLGVFGGNSSTANGTLLIQEICGNNNSQVISFD